jgi:conjugative relaxase-like TrwC/TraI family protein
MLGFAKGYSVSYLTGPVQSGREGYYVNAVAAGEPPGLWWGAGARELGLVGEVDSELMEAIFARLLDPRDEAAHSREEWAAARTLGAAHKRYSTPDELYRAALEREPDAGPERRAELQAEAERSSRQPVAFFDMTFSPAKSVTVLSVAFERAANEAAAAGDHEAAAAWSMMNKAVEAAVMAGARASIDYLEEVAGYARVGKHGGGAGRWGDANKFVVAQFLQHDSRDRDPQLHVHQAILNKLQRVDGEWTGVDERALKMHRWSGGAIGERVMEAELTRVLGVRWVTRKDGVAREIEGVSQDVMDLFSKRTVAVGKKAAELIAEYEERHGPASVLERKHLSEQATLLTRKAKSHTGETNEERLDRWEQETRTKLAGGLSQVAHAVLASRSPGKEEEWSPSQVIAFALAEVGKNEQVWTRSDLIFAISSVLPGHLNIPTDQVRPLLQELADKALADAVVVVETEAGDGLPAEFRLNNGLSVYQRPGSARYATPGQVAEERLNARAAVRTGAAKLTKEQADQAVGRFAAAGYVLGADQAAAVRGVLTSGACVEVLASPAGTGKSFTVGAIAEAWAEHGHRTFGLAASQNAADIMSDEGVRAFNISRWRGELARDDDLQLRPGDLVVVDEAGMASTHDVADIAQRCDEAGAKLLLVGDPRQLAPVGPGGALADVGARAQGYELTEVRRFSHGWEGDASLRLREGDLAALEDYDKHGRLRACGTTEQAEFQASRAWLADTLGGMRSLLIVGSNLAASRVNGELRAELVRLGLVEEQGVALGREGTVAGVGDVVQARRNNWRLETPVINRQTFRVTEANADGSLRVESSSGVSITLPADYVTNHLSLAYASTLHAAQGRTVDTGHDLTGTYVGMTRGRESNTAWVTTKPLASDAPVGEAQDVEPRTARAVLTDKLAHAEEERGALAQQLDAEEYSKSTFKNVDQLIDGIARVNGGRTSTALDRLAAEGAITPEQREALAADQAMGSVERLLRYAEVSGRPPEDVLRDALEGNSLAGARSAGQVLHKRIRNTLGEKVPQISSYRDLIPANTREREYLEELADKADERRHELGGRVAEEKSPWALETLGPLPADPLQRAVWESRAGWAAAYREGAEYTDEQDPLGSAPPAGLAEKHAIWATAHAALGLPDVGPEEAMLTDGQLLARAAAWDREQLWAPRYVADELAATSEQMADRRSQVELFRAHAETLDGDEKQGVLEAAEKAACVADELELRALDLEDADKVRTHWVLHTMGTKDRGMRSKAELGRRGVDLDNPADKTTAAEWLAAEAQDRAVGDAHRPIREEDIAEKHAVEVAASQRSVETAVVDLRDVAIEDPTERDPRIRREAPAADATADAVRRARETLLEIDTRDRADQIRLDEEEAERRATQWVAAPDHADEQARAREMS